MSEQNITENKSTFLNKNIKKSKTISLQNDEKIENNQNQAKTQNQNFVKKEIIPTQNIIDKNENLNTKSNNSKIIPKTVDNTNSQNILPKRINNEMPNKIIPKNVSKSEEIDNRLVIGFNEKQKPLFISESSRYLNTIIYGSSGTGKTLHYLPFLIEQDLKNKNVGCTIIINKQEMAYNIYTLAKQYKRKVYLLKPSTNLVISNKLLFSAEYNYDLITDEIICYKEAIKQKAIVIIDMEIMKYRSDGIKATSMLLLQLQLDIQETDFTGKTPHFLYVDDADYYLSYLKNLLCYSYEYNLGIILCLNSRCQLRNMKNTIDNSVRNIILGNNLNLEDFNYFSNLLKDYSGLDIETFNHLNLCNRNANTLLFIMIDSYLNKKYGNARYKKKTEEEFLDLEKKSKKMRTKLLKEKRTNQEIEIQLKTKNSMEFKEQVKGEPIPIDVSILSEEASISDFSTETEEEKAMREEKEHIEIRQEIIEDEKEQKRIIAQKTFNEIKKTNLDFCNDTFDFQF